MKMQTLKKNETVKLLKWNIKDCKEEAKKVLKKGLNIENYMRQYEMLARADALDYILCEILSKKYDV